MEKEYKILIVKHLQKKPFRIRKCNIKIYHTDMDLRVWIGFRFVWLREKISGGL
jgi:hypothetical protein